MSEDGDTRDDLKYDPTKEMIPFETFKEELASMTDDMNFYVSQLHI